MTEDTHRGRFVWFDLMTPDPEGAVNFYSALVGWGTRPLESGDIPYTMWTNRDTPQGAAFALHSSGGKA